MNDLAILTMTDATLYVEHTFVFFVLRRDYSEHSLWPTFYLQLIQSLWRIERSSCPI